MLRRAMGLSLAALVLCLLTATYAEAAAQRTFVASHGADTNPCTLPAPCRSFQAAITAVATGGEVIALDSAGYGPMTIDKSASVIVPPGVHAGIFVASGDAVTVNAGAGEVVILRGLYISATGATTGIRVQSVGRLQLEDVVVNGFIDGLNMTTAGKLTIVGSTFHNNTGDGLRLAAGSGSLYAAIERTTFDGNGNGIDILGAKPNVWIRDSLIRGHTGIGVAATLNTLTFGNVHIERCMISDNTVGMTAHAIAAGAGVIMFVSNSTILGNGTGWSSTGGGGTYGFVFSFGNNSTAFNMGGTTFDDTTTLH